MPTLLDYLKGVASEYGPGLRDAAAEELAERAAAVDAKLRDRKALKRVVGSVLDGLLESWRDCPHGVAQGQPCAKCKPELKP